MKKQNSIIDNKIIDQHISRQIRDIRIRKQLTLSYVAKNLGVSYQQVQKYETGQSTVSASKLFALSQILDVKINSFFDKLIIDTDENIATKPGRDISIVLIEDNPADESIFRKTLNSIENIEVLCLRDKEQFFKIIRHKRSSLSLPRMIFISQNSLKQECSGILRWIRNDIQLSSVPVIVLSSYIDKNIVSRLYRFGLSGFVLKAFDIKEFSNTLLKCTKYWIETTII
ncbi:MAG: helix-turn-helix domain-containing protein [Alphaproteobacteria bacterium]|nr:helix-turn-helix domain-containing protein [Alphaproteobacteria bacterium]